jgi:hypothetical protein
MTHILNLTRDDPVIHLKAYGGVQITGVDQADVQCEITAPQLATLVEEDGHVYVTVNASCRLSVPMSSSIEIERGMGSVKISNIQNGINVEKVLGNLVLNDIAAATIGKVGGNFSVRKASGSVQIEKVAGSLTVDDVSSFICEKVGGNCYARDIGGDFHLEKLGGKLMAQEIGGHTWVSKIGGSFVARGLQLQEDIKVGGNIRLLDSDCSGLTSLKAGGDIDLGFSEGVRDIKFSIQSGAHKIKIKTDLDDLEIKDYSYEYDLGDGIRAVSIAAGGSVTLTNQAHSSEDIVGDISDRFTYEESAFSELIQERIDSATRKAEAKVKTAEIRLDQIRERVAKHRGFDEGHPDGAQSPPRPDPPITRPAGKKGATDEERLMILKMLQDSKISVDEAEILFQALED